MNKNIKEHRDETEIFDKGAEVDRPGPHAADILTKNLRHRNSKIKHLVKTQRKIMHKKSQEKRARDRERERMSTMTNETQTITTIHASSVE